MLLDGGAWTSKNRKSMREKYYLSREQYIKMEVPTLKGTKHFSGLSKTLLHLHQQARDVA